MGRRIFENAERNGDKKTKWFNVAAKGKAKVSWENVCKPKKQGGLGLKDLYIWNKVLLAKHVWNIATKKDSLWVKWVHSMKLRGKNIWEISTDVNDSWGWKNLLCIRDLIRDNVKHIIGDGNDISLWLGWLYMWVCVSDPGDAFFIAIFPIRDDVDANVIGSGLEGNMFGALRSPRRELRNEPNYVQNGVEMNEIS
ncbi:hypothetical protein Tco_0204737 [Tanacetum coccineum]